ncbi:MAG: hypothetical protein NUV73_03975 [Candidatus Daviesbacteria bacterium]|nr:hypothetical protein [Candidatus Daviesbacteria bacterium]
MALELGQVIGIAESRNKLIPDLIRGNRVYWDARLDKTLFAQGVCALVTSGMRVKGASNLEEAARLAKTEEELLVTNHVSDGDHPARRKAFECLGYKEFADSLVYIGGLKMLERWWIRMFAPAEKMLLVPTPFDFDNLIDALKELRGLQRRGQLTEDEYGSQHELLKSYGKNLGILNDRAEEERERLIQEGMNILLYAEATRSGNGLLQRAPFKVVRSYAPKEKGDRWVFPIMGWGIEKIARANQSFKPGREDQYTVYGRPFPARELYEQDLRGQVFDKKPVTPADVLMARLGKLAPEKVDPHLQEFYADLARDYDPCIESEFQTVPGIFEKAMSLPLKFRDGLSQVGLAVERIQRGD